MRWFKHMTNSSGDEKLALLRDECGLAGYGFYWGVLEIIASQMDESGRTFCAYPQRTWCMMLSINHQTWSKLIASCEQVGLFRVSKNGQTIKVDAPNILKFRDEYTERQHKKSGQNRDKLPTLLIDLETDTEEEKIPEISGAEILGSAPESPPEISPELPPECVEFAREFQETVAREHGDMAPKITESLIAKGADALDKATRLDGFDREEVMAALLWGITADFWGDNLRSLAGMRGKMRNGVSKIQGVIGDYRKSRPRAITSSFWENAI